MTMKFSPQDYPELTWTVLADGPEDAEVLVVGPSLGTAVGSLWSACARRVSQRYRVVGWDLPGHGESPPCDKPFTVEDLAKQVLAQWPAGSASYAGVSVGGATGLELALLRSQHVAHVAVLCSAAKLGEAKSWLDRAETVRDHGTSTIVEGSRQRWFAKESLRNMPKTVQRLLDELSRVDASSYARVCEALSAYDLRDRLASIDVEVLAVAGQHDQVCPPWQAREIAENVRFGQYGVTLGAAHLAPVEQPDAVAKLLLAR